MSPRVRVAMIVAGAFVGLIVVLELIDQLSPSPKGPRSSSYATSPSGLAAYASVLERSGHRVRRLRTPIAEQAPRDDETLVILDPDAIDPDEARAIGDWVRAGGRLVAGGRGEAPWLEEVIGSEPAWDSDGGRERTPLLPVVETAGVREVRGVEGGAWHELGPALPVIGPAGAPLVITTRTGSGSVALIADPSPLHNRALGQADNAALGLALAGEDRQPVAFLETVHGYGVSRGFGGLPGNVKWALLGLALTTLVALWSVGRRFGPTEDPDIPLPPPRVEYVDALAAALARARKEARS